MPIKIAGLFQVSPFHAATILVLSVFDRCPNVSVAILPLAFARRSTVMHGDGFRSGLSIQRTMGAQRPYTPVNVALPKVWKCRSNPTSAAEAASFLASGSLSTSTAKTVIW